MDHKSQDVLLANSLTFEDNPSEKLLIYIKTNNGPSIEPWEAPALTLGQSETCSFNKNHCFLFLRKSQQSFSKLPDTPFCLNLKMRHSSQILSNAFDIPRKTSATTKSLSNDFYIL